MIKVEVIGVQQVVNNLVRARQEFKTGMRAVMEKVVIDLHKQVVQGKLSNQVLHVRTGNLRRSINWKVESIGDALLVGKVGTNSEYGAIHEYGGKLRTRMKAVTKHPRRKGFEPKAFFMMPERSFLRSALAENADRYKQMMQDGINKVVKRIKG